jgi:ppGpp synthetase/RelA/SpoT-type nucleotidyltranferase
MEDIGGCRAVVTDRPQLALLRARIEHKWKKSIQRTRDYIVSPRPTGYRAVHIIVERHGVPIEIQLRTRLQHRWAMVVEHYEALTRQPLKDGRGDEDLLRLMFVLAEAFAQMETVGAVDPALREELQMLQNKVDRKRS